jgi:polar amino acid transport system permease protein
VINWDYIASLDFSVAWEFREVLWQGFLTTLTLLALSSILGFLGGVVLAVGAFSRLKIISWLVAAYVELWRNTPLVVQLIWIHFALPTFTGINTTAWQSGLVTLVLGVTAYFTEIVRAGIGAIHRGQWEAAHALGLSAWTIWVRVILPQAVRIVVPPLASLVINVFKATAILSILSVNELMQVANKISNYTFKPVEIITTVATIYFITGYVLSLAAARLERSFRRADR